MESEGENVNHQSQDSQPVERWTEDEDALLIQLRSYKLSWSNIADNFANPRRTVDSCKSRYRSMKDRVQETERENNTALARLYESHKEEMWTKVAERMSTKPSWRVAEHNHWCIGRLEMERRAGEEFLTKAPVQIQQQDQQQVTKNPDWSGDEEAILLAKRSAHMQWKDISTCLPGRTVKGCQLRYHQLTKRCDGWSPELQNELCQQYYILKQRMWEQIVETMSVEWQVAERMHWELGKDGIAELAGVPLTLQPAANPTLTPQERGPTTKEWLNLVCQ
ncbi:hypothetical protein E4U16_004018 [Claviceps sp. LM84 group G4]|nr:hypothetical protein E4U16_004018 [Claviceps sp. LM84 group G4]